MAAFSSSTIEIPDSAAVPRHIAIIMDGNGRWAKKRLLPRVAGHRKGAESVRATVRRCAERGVEFLTLFAFSSENWRRPEDEVSVLMQLFLHALQQEVSKLHQNNIRFRAVGDLQRFDPRIVRLIEEGEKLTQNNSGLTLTVAANYGGRWDIMQAIQRMVQARGSSLSTIEEKDFASFLSMAYAPEPDLFIRTGGEQRISNFLLWQLAYTELHFTDTLWPDFGAEELDAAIASYQSRERRFGRTSEQVGADSSKKSQQA